MHPFWRLIARFILRGRIPILIVLGLLTAFMWHNRVTERDQAFAKVVPEDDPEYQIYKAFKEEFGEDGNVIIAAIEADLYQLDFYQDIYDLTEDIQSLEGIEQVVSLTHLYTLVREDSLERFELKRLSETKPLTQAEVDVIKGKIDNLPFYKGLFARPYWLLLFDRHYNGSKSIGLGGQSPSFSKSKRTCK